MSATPALDIRLTESKPLFMDVLATLLKSGKMKLDDRILVVCGGSLDHDILLQAGFVNVTISNLDTRYRDYIAPYEWSSQDAEDLTFANEEFDIAIVHMGLHHCFSPHRALLEMLRVSRLGALVFENRDSLLLNLAIKLGVTVDYELEAVTHGKFLCGGAANGPIPNFIYRWTEREVIKTVKSAYPAYPAKAQFFYRLRIPYGRFEHTSRTFLKYAIKLLQPLLELTVKLAKKQGNEFGFFIEKQEQLHPWLQRSNDCIRVNEDYAVTHGRMFLD